MQESSASPGRSFGRLRAACGFLAFLIGFSLVLEGAAFFWRNLSTSYGRRWLLDSFSSDWQSSREFQSFVEDRLGLLLTMGAAKQSGTSQTYYGRLHDQLKEDKNALYIVKTAEGKTLYRNIETVQAISDSYTFRLTFDGEKVQIQKNGQPVEVYSSQYYDPDSGSDPWYVPGYANFPAGDSVKDLRITLAILNEPQVFIQGNYDRDRTGTSQYNQLYYIKQNLENFRQDVLDHLARLGVGLVLVVVYVLLRRDKVRVDRALARGTGRLWLEVKLLLAVLLVFCFLPRSEIVAQTWRELTYAFATAATPQVEAPLVSMDSLPASASEAETEEYYAMLEDYYNSHYNDDIGAVLIESEDSGVAYVSPGYAGQAVRIFAENADWLLREYLSEASQHISNFLLILWGLYLLLVNDWRYNRKPWKCSLCACLAARELKYPLQKRLHRETCAAGLAFGLVSLVAAYLFLAVISNFGGSPLWWLLLVLAPCVLALGLILWVLKRQSRLWNDFGAVADQLSAIRSGALTRELELPRTADLHQMADDLNHIQQGLQQAVDQRTRSERMKVELVANVSHDLKTPLTSIISYTELLEQEQLEPPAGDYVKILSEKAQRLKAMVQDVFEVSKAASGDLPVRLKQLDFGRLLRQTLADMDAAISGSGLTFRVSIPDTPVPITADSDRMYRVFQNLIGNALKYSLPGSRVYLTLWTEEGLAQASLKNTSAAELKPGTDYTGRFVRGDESRTDGGSGLGLSIAESFTQACGGTLDITTEADLFTATVCFPISSL